MDKTGGATSMTIVYFGNDWSAENRTSSHHIARCLAHRCHVHYVECPGLRAPRGSGRDFRRIVQKLWRSLSGPREVMPRLVVHTLLQIPLHRWAVVRWLNARLVRWKLRRLIKRHHIAQPITWFVLPHLASLCGELGEDISVYYCIDDYAALPGVDADAVQAMDETLTRKADIVFVASETLMAAKSHLNPNTFHSPHGVDVEHFAIAHTPDGRVPEDIQNLPHPVIGFFGLIERWIDVELVAYLAEQRPHWSFLMIGHVALPQSVVPQLPNLHFLGKRPYEQLPDYGRQFAVAIIPYKLTQQVIHANPLKLREYLAMGKPVVSVSTPEIDGFADVVEIAHSREEFLTQLDSAVTACNDAEAAHQRMQRVSDTSWDVRTKAVLLQVQDLLARKHRGGYTSQEVDKVLSQRRR